MAHKSVSDVIRAQGRIWHALMLRDLRSRFFGHGLGYLIAIAWPLTHIGVLVIINTFLGRMAPYGESPVVFFSTGVLPYVIFSYISRFTMLSVVQNRPLIAFPVVKILDIIIARGLLEILAAVCTTLLLVMTLWLCNVEFWPRNLLEALYALGVTCLLGFGYGIVNGVIAAGYRIWVTVYILVLIVYYATSGVFFVTESLPAVIRYPLSFNPLLQCIEWLRSAYYDGYGSGVLDKQYVIGCAIFAIFLGLVIERVVRGRLLQG